MKEEDPLETAWSEYDELKTRLVDYIVSSEEEFASLIEALDNCWTLAESVQGAAGRLAEMTSTESGSPMASARDTMLDGCHIFRSFLDEIRSISGGLLISMDETQHLLRNSLQLQEDLLPLNYIAFAFRLEGARLSPEYREELVKVTDEMQLLLRAMKQSGESQQQTLLTVVDRLSVASSSVEAAATAFTVQAGSSEKQIHEDLDLLAQVPPDLREKREAAGATGTLIVDGIREAAKALQGHDAIRQQMDHVFGALDEVRRGRGMEAGHALVLQRQQAKHIQHLIEAAGTRIEQELNTVMVAARSITTADKDTPKDSTEAEAFESTVDRLTTLSAEIASLLKGEIALGRFIMTQIEPIHALLNSKSRELEELALSLKMLALNVLITAEHIPGAREVDVLGLWTAGAAERVLDLARSLNAKFSHLAATLQSRGETVVSLLGRVESTKEDLHSVGGNGTLRNSRRNAYNEVAALGQEGLTLQEKTESLLQSLTFVAEGRELLELLISTLESMLLLYPAPQEPLDYSTVLSGYAMQDQHEVHALVFGGDAATKFARLSEPAPDADYGDNVELF